MSARSRVPFLAAAVQASPVFLDRDATVAKACDLLSDAARQGARLAVFPEAFVPAYPDWVWALRPREGRELGGLYAELLANAVDVPGPVTEQLGAAARAAKAYLVIGVNERNAEASGTSLFNTLLTFDDTGRLIGRHRKLVPTAAERLVWAAGDGSTFGVLDTALGKLAGLICWENYMPLARYALIAWGAEILCSPTWDKSDTWLASLRHIANEGCWWVIGCCQALRVADIPERHGFRALYPEGRTWINVGNSAIVDPDGKFVAGPLAEAEGVLLAEIDPAHGARSRRMLDVAGHYARPDVFQLTVRRSSRPMIVEATWPEEESVPGTRTPDPADA
ncbi:MAG TPA: carbon-nitrogen hydrolase family protein [Candidatus Eisenbacteria bacterium]|nr:carbon-nitrogen hydrolase family protein [Candidatus Eisenbacteria bacterium]